MNASLKQAAREAYALAPSDVAVLETLTFTHPSWEAPVYLVKNREDLDLTLETGETVTFTACAFRMALPAAGENGLQEIQIAVDNVDRVASDALLTVATSKQPVQVVFRPYLSNDTTAPQMDPPLTLFLTDATITSVEVVCRATFADVLNRSFPSQYYVRRRFPALGA